MMLQHGDEVPHVVQGLPETSTPTHFSEEDKEGLSAVAPGAFSSGGLAYKHKHGFLITTVLNMLMVVEIALSCY